MTTQPLSQADLLALLRRICDPGWLSGMLAQPDGQAIINAWLAAFEATSVAVCRQVDASMISTAPTGSPGVCTLVLSRADTTVDDYILQGYTFVTNLGVQLVVATQVHVLAGQATVALPLLTLRQTDIVNTVEPAFDDVLNPGDYLEPILGSADPSCVFFDAPHNAGTLTYVSSTPITGATDDWLSAHGEERGCKRQEGEDGEAYRARVRLLPDAVSPRAVARALDGACQLLPERWLVEPFGDGADPLVRLALQLGRFDVPACDMCGETITLSAAPATDWAPGDVITGQTSGASAVVVAEASILLYYIKQRSGAFALGETVGVTGVPAKLATQNGSHPIVSQIPSGFCDDWLGDPVPDKQPIATCEMEGLRESRAYVRVDLFGDLQDPDGSVLYCDDGGYCDDELWGYPDIEVHPAIGAASKALLDELRGKLAAGVQWDIYLENGTQLAAYDFIAGPTGPLGVPVWSLAAPPGKAWYIKEGLLTVVSLDPTEAMQVILTLADASQIISPWTSGAFPLRTFELAKLGYCGQPVVQIDAWARLSGPLALNLQGNFDAIQATL